MSSGIIVLVLSLVVAYFLRRLWEYNHVLPEGYTLKIVEQGKTYEKIHAYDSGGNAVNSYNHTSVYGFKGASRNAVRAARKHKAFLNTYPKQIEIFNENYGENKNTNS